MSRDPTVSATVTYHDRPQTIGRVLDALLAQTHPLERIVVVDNGSQPPLEEARSVFKQISRVRIDGNTGLSQARNVGLQQLDSELVLIVDDDVYLAPNCLSLMVDALLETGAAAVCPRIVFHNGDAVVQCDGASIHFAGMLTLVNRGAAARSSPAVLHECIAFIGACFLIRRQLLMDLGGFDEDYFFYFEDLELSHRLRSQGHKFWCEPAAVALHDRGRGTPDLSFRGYGAYPLQRAFLNLRNRWLSMALHYEAHTLRVLAPALALYEMAAFAEVLRRGWLLQWIRAWRSLLGERADILRRRRRWKSTRVTADVHVLSGGPLPFAEGFSNSRFTAWAAGALSSVLDLYWIWARKWL
jgi:GT2 family glycosyltransferase